MFLPFLGTDSVRILVHAINPTEFPAKVPCTSKSDPARLDRILTTSVSYVFPLREIFFFRTEKPISTESHMSLRRLLTKIIWYVNFQYVQHKYYSFWYKTIQEYLFQALFISFTYSYLKFVVV